MPMASPIEEDVNIRGKLKRGLCEVTKGDFSSEEIARLVSLEHAGSGQEWLRKVVVQYLSACIGRAKEDVLVLEVGL